MTTKTQFYLLIAAAVLSLGITACHPGSPAENQNTDMSTPTASFAETTATPAETETNSSDATIDDTQELSYQLTDSMEVKKDSLQITQTDTVHDITYSLTVNLEKAAGYTSEEQIITCTRVFWYCYPRMYEKMAVEDTPVDVYLLIEDEGYEIAEQWDDKVHLHDRWLCDNPGDYDCLTHEFAHVIQTNWDGDHSPHVGDDAYLIERFADACRYIYAYEDGLYNNELWTLHTPDVEGDYASSNRFWVWIEQTFSNDEVDVFRRLVTETQIHDNAHESTNWDSDGPMWDVIFEGTEAQGKSLDQLWADFVDTEFAWQ